MPVPSARRGVRWGWLLLITVAVAVALWLSWLMLQGRGPDESER